MTSSIQNNRVWWRRARRGCGLLITALALFLGAFAMATEPFSLERLQAAAQKGDAKALYSLSKRYWKGDGVPPDSAKSTEYLKKAADKGYAPAQNDLGAFYAKRKKHAEAAKWYRKAAEQGDDLAQYNLGQAYWLGRGVETNAQAALKWLRKAARRNLTNAVVLVGEIYMKGGPGLNSDRRHAFRWLAKAADQGSADAYYSLGRLYEQGNGATRNLHAAVSCYIQAAEKGEARAPRRLSELSVPDSEWKSDIIEAIKWLRVAIMHGDLDANRAMNNLGARFEVSGEQYKEACRRALDFERANGRELGKQEEQELNRSKQR